MRLLFVLRVSVANSRQRSLLDFAHILKFRVLFQKYPALLERQALWGRFVLLTKPRTALLVFMPLALSFQ